MPLITPRLDDRRFQDIVDEAKSRIPRYCPEWTDHNVSDPGVALIELFAWMTDLLLYRLLTHVTSRTSSTKRNGGLFSTARNGPITTSATRVLR